MLSMLLMLSMQYYDSSSSIQAFSYNDCFQKMSMAKLVLALKSRSLMGSVRVDRGTQKTRLKTGQENHLEGHAYLT